jgi:XRE family transcriptional regulator, regulator of sulfur utilization
VARDPLDRLGRNVLRIRTERGLTQEQVADTGGLALSDVGRIERGQRDPGVRVLVRLARGLRVGVTDLLAGVD